MTNALQQGMAAFQARRLEEAEQWFRQVLAADPDDIAARSYLGQALCHLGRRLEGTQQLREAATDLLDHARDGLDIGHALEVIQQLQQHDDFPAAFELGQQAVAIAPGEARAWQQLAVAAAMTNRAPQALAACAEALKHAPDHAMTRVLMGSLEADARQHEAALARLEGELARGLPPREAFRAHKELARVLDRLARYDEVFPHLRASAKLAAELPEYTGQPARQLVGMIQANRLAFDAALMGRFAGSAALAATPAPVFLIGFYRSGTTLTQEVLGAHPDLLVTDEADFVWAMQRELHRLQPGGGGTAAKLRALDEAGIARLRQAYWQRVHGRIGDTLGGRRLVDKFTMNTLDIGLIHTVFPDAQLLFVQRDPRDVCLSAHLQLMVPGPATAHLVSWGGTAAFYDQVMGWWTHIRGALTMPCHEFRYEDLVTDFQGTVTRLLGFLGLPWHEGVTRFHERASGRYITSPSRGQVAQPLYASSVSRWQHYAGEFAEVDALLAPWVRALGYTRH